MPIEFGDSLFKEFHGELGPDGEFGPDPEEEQDPERGPLNKLDRMKLHLEIMNKELEGVRYEYLNAKYGIRAQYLEGNESGGPAPAQLFEQWQSVYEKQAAEVEAAERRYDEIAKELLPPYIATLEASLKEDLDSRSRRYCEHYLEEAKAELQTSYDVRYKQAVQKRIEFLEGVIEQIPERIAWAERGREAEAEVRHLRYWGKLREAELAELRASASSTPRNQSV
jgi:hypothetical protein